ncbi:MAG: hypothetical protein JSW20_00720 [Nitrospiraceae bacterium]|nr:MAG: hypothetical protein JSW20_00720 [Nitrospiraceae bacterium]
MRPGSAIALICSAIIGLTHVSISSRAEANNAITAGNTTRLSIVVKGIPSQAALLHWVLYASKDALPGLFSRGQPYRKGSMESFGDTAVIEVGEVPGGTYFAIVGQDIDGSKDIAKFSEPRGYSGYNGCWLPSWEKGARYVKGEQSLIEVVLGCNASIRELSGAP